MAEQNTAGGAQLGKIADSLSLGLENLNNSTSSAISGISNYRYNSGNTSGTTASVTKGIVKGLLFAAGAFLLLRYLKGRK